MTFVTVEDLLRLGFEHHRARRLAEAEKAYRQVLLIDPRNAKAMHLLGVIAQHAGQHEAAASQIAGALAIDPSQPESHYNLGNSLLHLKQFDRAADAFAAALERSPDFFEARRNLGSALMLAGRADEAVDAFAVAAKLKPDAPDVQNNWGMALRTVGQVDEAIDAFRRALALAPAFRAAQDNLLYTLHFHPAYDAKGILLAHREWASQFADPSATAAVQFANDRDPDRRLRIGYVSPNLREHPVGRAMLPLLEQHDRERFEVICYADAGGDDAIRQRLKGSSEQWRETGRLTDAQLTEQIRKDGIDILVDTTLHMTANRLPVFAQRAAPVQVTFVGYPATTGLTQIDYRITDPWLDPPGETESANSEQLIRLPRSFWCYDDSGASEPAVGELPAIRHGFITFGSLNNPCKISDPTIEAWARILVAVPSSRLMLYAAAKAHPGEAMRRRFEQHGVDASRLLFVPRAPREQYLRQYQQIDIALDPWPYNGHTTSCDALWMGVPVVSLISQTSVGRGGLSILTAMGLSELIARSVEEYVAIATKLAGDHERLVALRSELRQRMRRSSLMDAMGFSRDVESIFRLIWKAWCGAKFI